MVGLLLLSWVASPASAQRAILLPVGGDPELVARHGAEVSGVLRAQSARASLTILSESELAGLEPCGEPSCAGPVLRATGAGMAIGAALWRREGTVQVAVVLIDPDGHEVSASTEGADASVPESAGSAFGGALVRWATRAGREVRVSGTPEGASVTIDRELWGTIPHAGSLSPGDHRFVVSAADHQTERRTVHVQLDPGPLELRFELVREASGGGDLVLGLAIGIPAIVLGGAAIALGSAWLAEGTSCASASCGPEVPVEGRSISRPAVAIDAAWIGLGSALVIGGVVWIAISAAQGSASGHRRAARVGDRGLALEF